MAEQSKRPQRTFEHLEELTVEQLEELLCVSADFSDEDKDEEYVDAIVDAIVKKEHENPTGRLPNVDKAWQSFRENFDTEEGEGLSLYPDEVEAKRPLVRPVLTESLPKRNPRRGWISRFHTMGRAAAIVAITVVLTVGGMVGAQASGLNVFGYLAQWTNDTFSFVVNPGQAKEPKYLVDFREILEQHQIPAELVPTWIPEGFHTDGPIYDEENPFCDSVRLYFNHSDGREFTIRVDRNFVPEDIEEEVFEKDSTDAELYMSNGRAFYIFSNIDTVVAVWAEGPIVETISGSITVEELEQIIASIGG